MALQDESYANITELLSMHKSCISSWKPKFVTQGLAGIKLAYKGAHSYLTPAQRTEVFAWLKAAQYWNLEALVTYSDEHYGLICQSKQSYYELFSSADISWNKSQKLNPKLDPKLVKERLEIVEFLAQNQSEIEIGQLVVFFVDECHLLWGDVRGYVWGKTNIQIKVPIQNERDLNYQTKGFIIREYSAGNSENTVAFLKDLQSQCPERRIAVIWDGASYHKSKEMKAFLASVNHGYESAEW
jgi:putative transposase